jgi:hypothetical protein
MNFRPLVFVLAGGAVLALVTPAVAQRGDSPDRRGVPEWEVDRDFAADVFTFVRIRYKSHSYGRRRGYRWDTDYPDADLNLSFRLQQLTSLKVDPNGLILELGDPRLFDYPFVYLIEPGDLLFDEAEVKALRRYLDQGGFMMIDDFWGEPEWANCYEQLKRVFPDREPIEVPLSHEIFHCVYDLKEKPQIPSIHTWRRWGVSSERGRDSATPHYKAFFDAAGRIQVFICHNTDLGDGWEREGEDEEYFHAFSEKSAYPLGINIITYALTH